MKNNIKNYFSWIWIAIGFLFFVILYYIVITYFHKKNTVPQVCVDKVCFTVEIARTKAEQEQGLMNREIMSDYHGMLFIFPQTDFYNFWMKNTRIPLDMLWIDDSYKIVRIITAQACTSDPCPVYKPEVFAKYVIEINAGSAEKYKITEGNIVSFQNIK